ncbi:MAG: crosslink repair DNA glycosylase YcaQ family protein [Bacteroidota bacterium]
MKLYYRMGEIEAWRDRTHRRLPHLALRSEEEARVFIGEVGFCSAHNPAPADVPSLWQAVCGERIPAPPRIMHPDPTLALVSRIRNLLPGEGTAFYGRLLRRQPALVSLDLFPCFFALGHRAGLRNDYKLDYTRGRLSRAARDLMEALRASSPQVSHALRLGTGMHGRDRKTVFEKALAELQSGLYVFKSGGNGGPATSEWALVDRRFAPQVRKARRIMPAEGRERILEAHVRNQLVVSAAAVQKVFGWTRQEVFQALGRLVRRGVIARGAAVENRGNNFYCWIQGS